MRIISASAALVGERPPAEAITIAAAAGYRWVGLRLDRRAVSSAELRAARARLDETGLQVLDVEVARLGHDAEHRADVDRLIDSGRELGARFVLCVGEDPEPSRLADRFAAVCDRAAAAGMRAALEWMPFRAVATLPMALRAIRAANHPAGALVVDALHLARSGGTPDDLRGVPARSIGYVQLCDAPAPPPTGGLEALAREARESRLYPGAGGLRLRELLATLANDVPLSVEVPNAASRSDSETAARLALAAVEALLAD